MRNEYFDAEITIVVPPEGGGYCCLLAKSLKGAPRCISRRGLEIAVPQFPLFGPKASRLMAGEIEVPVAFCDLRMEGPQQNQLGDHIPASAHIQANR